MKDRNHAQKNILRLLDFEKIRSLQESNGDSVMPDYVIEDMIGKLFEGILDYPEIKIGSWKLQYNESEDKYILSYTPYVITV